MSSKTSNTAPRMLTVILLLIRVLGHSVFIQRLHEEAVEALRKSAKHLGVERPENCERVLCRVAQSLAGHADGSSLILESLKPSQSSMIFIERSSGAMTLRVGVIQHMTP
ncbi:hypothetical protein EV361DRAFT_935542 [Lentinula raphanica]|nr:hypothetical protein EV361DRAFT_935542 [Lentinula raphanica]